MPRFGNGRMNRKAGLMPMIDAATRSVVLHYAPGLIDVYGGGRGKSIMLTVRREPHDVYEMRSVLIDAETARALAAALVCAAEAAEANK